MNGDRVNDLKLVEEKKTEPKELDELWNKYYNDKEFRTKIKKNSNCPRSVSDRLKKGKELRKLYDEFHEKYISDVEKDDKVIDCLNFIKKRTIEELKYLQIKTTRDLSMPKAHLIIQLLDSTIHQKIQKNIYIAAIMALFIAVVAVLFQ